MTGNAFAWIVGLGASFGMANLIWRGDRARDSQRLMNAGLIVLAGALCGGRAGFVAASWTYFQLHPGEIPQFWLGGFSGSGAFAGGVLFVLCGAWLTRLPLKPLSDRLLPLLPPVVVSAWLAGWLAGTAYGAKAPGAWWAVPTRDEFGSIDPRLPLQPLAAVLTLFLFWLIDRLRPRLGRQGQAAALALLSQALLLLGASFLRADAAPIWMGLRWDLWGGMILSALALIYCLVVFWPVSKLSEV